MISKFQTTQTRNIVSSLVSALCFLSWTKVKSSASYKANLSASLAGFGILICANVYFWEAVFSDSELVGGCTKQQMLLFSITSIALSAIFHPKIEGEVAASLRDGSIEVMFISPISPILRWFANDFGQLLANIISPFAPLLLVSYVTFRVNVSLDCTTVFLFCASTICGFLILWLLSAILAIGCFWYLELGYLTYAKNAIVRLLSGSIVPSWLFPRPVETILDILPFRYTYQLPIEILMHRLDLKKTALLMFVQIVWLLILLFIVKNLWSKARRQLQIQGG